MRLPSRGKIEDAIESLIAVLDEIDGDADRESDPVEEQHDAERDEIRAGARDTATLTYVVAEMARRTKARP